MGLLRGLGYFFGIIFIIIGVFVIISIPGIGLIFGIPLIVIPLLLFRRARKKKSFYSVDQPHNYRQYDNQQDDGGNYYEEDDENSGVRY